MTCRFPRYDCVRAEATAPARERRARFAEERPGVARALRGCNAHPADGRRVSANSGPHLALVLIHGSFFAHAGMDHQISLPVENFDEPSVQRLCSTQKTSSAQRRGPGGHDTIFADDAVLLSAGDHFCPQAARAAFCRD